jgi:flagellar biosynthesis/type III secretory pathway M-ring protein FliF/YscJ
MNSKTITYLLGFLLLATLVFAFYSHNRAGKLDAEKTEWQAKYEEALIDAEESGQRIEKMKEELELALKESEEHRKQAEAALRELQKRKR